MEARHVLLGVLGAIAVAGVTACGSDEETTPAATATAAASVSGEPIVIGTTGPYTSQVIALPEAREAAEAAVEAINADGGVQGRPLELESCDDQLNPNQATACGRRLAENDDVVAIAGSTSVMGDFFVPVIEKAGLADIGAFPISKTALQSPASFPMQGGTFIQYAGAAKAVVDSGWKRPVVIYHDIPTIQLVLDAIDMVFAEAGMEAVGKVAISPSATDVSPALAKAQTYDPDAILLAFPEPQISQAILNAHQTGTDVPLVTGAGDLTADALEKLGPAAEGLTSVEPLPPLNAGDQVPAIQRFEDELGRFAPDAKRSAIALNAWAAVHMAADVMEGLDEVDRASVTEAMNQLSGYDTDGLTPPLDYTGEPKIPEVPRLFNTSADVSTVEDGARVWTGEFLDVTRK